MEKRRIRYRIGITALAVALSLLSCEKIIDISIPDKEYKIVVNGRIMPDQEVRINLSRSTSVIEPDTTVFIKGAEVNFFNGPNLIGKLLENSSGYYYLPDFNPKAGDTYRLTAENNDLKPVEAFATLPPVVPILSVDTVTIPGERGKDELRISVTFKDPPQVQNYYGLILIATYKEFNYQKRVFTGKKVTNQINLTNNKDWFLRKESNIVKGKLYFDDLLFDGTTNTVNLDVADFSTIRSDTIWLNINMEQVDMPYYRYLLSFQAYEDANDNPLAEPVQVYTNVKNGFGILAGSTSFTKSIIAHTLYKSGQ